MPGKAATIRVIGPIGTFTTLENGKPVKTQGMQLVDFTRQLTRLEEGTKEVTIEVGGMGGSVPVAKAMRGVIKAYGSRYKFTTKQVDDIASAHTIIFSAAEDRLAAKGINPATGKPFNFLVHNPWVGHTEGDADQLAEDSNDLRITENELIAIYQEDTGIDKEAIGPLMKVESVFDADQAVDLGFATATYPALNQAAYKSNTMAKQPKKDKTLAQRVLAALGITETSEVVAVAPPATLMGKPVMIDNAAAVDGVYTVVGGVVTALAEAPEAQAPAAAAPGAAAPAAAAPGKPVAAMTTEEIVALVNKAVAASKKKKTTEPDPDDADDDDDDDDQGGSKEERMAVAIAKALGGAIDQKFQQFGRSQKGTHTPIGFKPEDKGKLAAEWDRSFKANEHKAMRRDNPDRWAMLFFAKYGKMPE